MCRTRKSATTSEREMIPFRHREGSIATGGSGRVGPQPTARRPNGSAVSTGPWPGDLRTETVAAGYFIAVGVRDEDATTLSPSRHGARGASERSRPRHATNGWRLKRPQSLLEQCSRFCRYHGTRFLMWRVGAAIPGPAPGATPCPTKDPGSVIRPNGTKLVATY
jgi:hypothetical protein